MPLENITKDISKLSTNLDGKIKDIDAHAKKIQDQINKLKKEDKEKGDKNETN